MRNANFSRVIGIDLGTTNSCVAVLDGRTPRVLVNEDGDRTTPSVVAFDSSGNVLVGKSAKRQAILNPRNTLFSTKRLIGRRSNDPMVVREKSLVPYPIVEHSNGDAWVRANKRDYSPSEIGAFVLMKMKETAELYLPRVHEAVITVPAYFNDSQRQATRDAGRIAGFDVKRIINEPTAASLTYGLDKSKTGIVVVFDLGGGTFDVSILEIQEGVFQVRATNGDTFLGGEDFDNRIVRYMLDEFELQYGVKLENSPMALQRIREAAERAKCDLSTVSQTEIQLPFIHTARDGSAVNLTMLLTREKLEQLTDDLVQRCIGPSKRALKDAGITSHKQITEVILVGGMTRMPVVRQLAQNLFGKIPSQHINPDECVALGAAIQGGILAGQMSQVVLVDVTPLTLGTSIVGDIYVPIIPKNSSIPCKRSHMFTTLHDNQRNVHLDVYQGERSIGSENKLLGSFVLDGIPPAPRGVPQIQVTFDIDANGIVHAHARDLASGSERAIAVHSKSGLSEEQIQQMVKDAERFAVQDKKRKEMAVVTNEVDATVHLVRSHLRELANRVSEEELEKAELQIKQVQQVMPTGNLTLINEAHEALKKTQQSFSRHIYLWKGPKQ